MILTASISFLRWMDIDRRQLTGSEPSEFVPTQNDPIFWRLESIPESRRARNDISMERRVLEDIESVSLEVKPNSTLSKLVTSFKNVPMSVGSMSLMIVRDERARTSSGEWTHTIFLLASPRGSCRELVSFERGSPKMRGSRDH